VSHDLGPAWRRRHWLLTALAAAGAGGWSPRAGAAAPVVRAGVPLQFPRDFGSHPAYRTEWWYITGRLDPVAGGSGTLGFQVTFFRSRVDGTGDQASPLSARHLILAHAALTDLAAGELLHDQRLARAGLGLAGAAEADTDVHLHDWRLRRDSLGGEGPGGRSRYTADLRATDFALQLTLDATQPLLLQGRAGYSRKGPLPEQASHYYSQPQLAVQGRVQRRGGEPVAVRGRAWMDHEWSESLLAPEAVGWDWIGMSLHDGSALTAFRLRRADGRTLWAGGSFRPPGQPARIFTPDELRWTPGRLWRSPATGASYPVTWTVDTPVGRFAVRARLDAQELDGRQGSGTVYWEGLSELLDAPSGRVVGEGYLEMTGYARRMRL